jgi:Tfp pilus assembly protein PilO
MNVMPIKDLYKALIATTIILAIAAGGYLFLFINIKNSNEKSSQLLVETQTESIREAKLKALKRSVSQTSGTREKLEQYILSEDDSVVLIERIEELGSGVNSQVSIQSVRLEPYQDEAFEWVVFSLSAYGSWDSVMRFVSLLENLPYRTEMSELLIERGDGEGVSNWQAKTILRVLKRK